MKILLLGANGQVGHALRIALEPLGEMVAATRTGALEGTVGCERGDLDDVAGLQRLVERVAPDVVVNAAAYTAVDRAEDEPAAAYRANAEAPAVLALACATRGALLVHYSTDYVFDGQATRPYLESDPTAPLGVYGASKFAGEQAIIESGCGHMIFRTAWVYGGHGSNFMRTMLRLGAQREELSVVADQFGTPTPAVLIAEVTKRALQADHGKSGLWHLTAAGQTSWHGFAQAIFEEAMACGLIARAPEVLPLSTSQYPTRAKRPAYSCLDTTALSSTFELQLPGWRQALAQVLSTLPK
jgi:dTDP-4-dehydrorhamnose reductase